MSYLSTGFNSDDKKVIDHSYFISKWTYITVTKKDLKLYTHIDGILKSSMDISNPRNGWSKPMSINYGGKDNIRNKYTTGYIDDFNIVDEAIYDEFNFKIPTKYFDGKVTKCYKLFDCNNIMYGMPPSQ